MQYFDATMQRRLIAILRRYGVRRAGLFGSFARGEAADDSDVDVLYESPPDMGLFAAAAMGNDLEAVVHRRVDLVTFSALRSALRDRIMADYIVLLPKGKAIR